MSKKTIVLADNSYTIRRIVELSFSEEENIQLVSFENSYNLREKLMELRPAVVLVDIKLPEFNGYEVCRFVNKTEGLKHTRVFLLKGGFEPVDEGQLKGLRFEDIITKPFDSNALVTTIKKMLEHMPAASGAASVESEPMPSSIPEDFPEIADIRDADDGISFSDIKDEIDSQDMSFRPIRTPQAPSFPMDDVMPSEEITYQSDREDELASAQDSAEDFDNPFADDLGASAVDSPMGEPDMLDEEMNIKMNIQQQERELDMASLTQEEMEIKRQIGSGDRDMFSRRFGAIDEPDLPEIQDDMPDDLQDMQDMPGGMDDGLEDEERSDTSELLKGDELEEPVVDEDDFLPSFGGQPLEKPYNDLPDLGSFKFDEEPSFDAPEEEQEPDFASFGTKPQMPPSAALRREPLVHNIPDLEPMEVEQEMGLGADDFEAHFAGKKAKQPDYISGFQSPASPFDKEFGALEAEPGEIEEPSFKDQFSAPDNDLYSAGFSGNQDEEPEFASEVEAGEEYRPASPFADKNASLLDEFEPIDEEPSFAPVNPGVRENKRDYPSFDDDDSQFSDSDLETPVVHYEASTSFEDDFAAPLEIGADLEEPLLAEFTPAPTAKKEPEYKEPVYNKPKMDIPSFLQEPAVKRTTPSSLGIPAPPKASAPEKPAAPVTSRVAPETFVSAPKVEKVPAIDQAELMKRVEDKLAAAIKEILWEVIPPLAEKVITEEIERIKAEVTNSFK